MQRFRRKPVYVRAFIFTKEMAEGNEKLPYWVRCTARETKMGGKFPEYMQSYKDHECEALRSLANYDHFHRHYVKTPDGEKEVKIGDWIITDDCGEHYICKPDVFEAIYDAVKL